MAERKRRVNKWVLVVLVGIVVLIGVGVVWRYRGKISDTLFPKDPNVAETRGDKATEAGDYGKAVSAYGEAVKWYKEPEDNDRACVKLSRAYLDRATKGKDVSMTRRTESYRRAVGLLQGLMRRSPRCVAGRELLCDIFWGRTMLLSRGRPKAGLAAAWGAYIREATELLKIKPEDHEAYYRRGQAYYRSAQDKNDPQVQKADEDLRKAVALAKDKPDYWIELATFLLWQGKDEDAGKVYAEAIQALPKDRSRVRVVYAYYLRKHNESDKALQQLHLAIKEQPDETYGRLMLASFLRSERELDKAVAILEEARKVDETDFRVYGELAAIYLSQQKTDQAIQTLRDGLAAVKKRSEDPATTTQPEGSVVKTRLKVAKIQLTGMLGNSLMGEVESREKDTDTMFQEAKGCLKELEELAPNSSGRMKLSGRVALKEGESLEALRYLVQAHEAYRDAGAIDGKIASLLVRLYVLQGLRGKAEKVVDDVLAFQKTPHNWVLKARLQIDSREFEAAETSLREALRLDPRYGPAANLIFAIRAGRDGRGVPEQMRPTDDAMKVVADRAMVLAGQQKPEQGIALLEELHRKAPDNRTVILRLVEMYEATKSVDKAASLLKQAIAKNPDDEILKRMLKTLTASQDDRIAMRMADIDKMPDEFRRALARADFSRQLGKQEDFLKYLQAAAALKPDDAEVVSRQFQHVLAKSDWKTAEGYVEKAKRLNLDRCGGALFAAQLTHARQEYPKAIEHLRAALKTRSELKLARVLLGECYLRVGEVDKAEQEYDRAIRDDPAYGPAAKGLARVAELKGNLPDHARWITRAHQLMPWDAVVREQYLTVIEERGNPQEIIRQREDILKRNPNDMQNCLRLAGLYEDGRIRRLAEAEALYRKIYQNQSLERRVRTRIMCGFLARQKRHAEVNSIYDAYLSDNIGVDSKVRAYIDYGWLLGEHSEALAVSAFKKAIALKKDEPTGYGALGQFLAGKKRWAEAADAMARYVQLRPEDRGARSNLAAYETEAGRFERAMAQADKLIADDPSDPVAHTLRGYVLLKEGNPDEAEKSFTKALAIDPNHAAALSNRAQVHRLRGEPARAKRDLTEARRMSKDPAIAMRLGRLHQQLGETTAARRVYRAVLREYPDLNEAIVALADIYARERDWAAYDKLIIDAIKRNPDNPRHYLDRARGLRVQGQMRQAIEATTHALALAPDSVDVLTAHLLTLVSAKEYKQVLDVSRPYAKKKEFATVVAAISARALVALNEPAKAEGLFKAALKYAKPGQLRGVVAQMRTAYGNTCAEKLKAWLSVKPKSCMLRLHLGNLYYEAKQWQQAVKTYQEGVSLAATPAETANAWTRVGLVYLVSGEGIEDLRKAEAAYKKARQSQPDNLQALNNLAYLYSTTELKNMTEAEKFAKLAFDAAPGHPDVIDTYAWILALRERPAQAERLLNRAIQIGGSTEMLLYHLGWVYEHTGRPAQARTQYQEAQKLAAKSDDKKLKKDIEDGLKRLTAKEAGGGGK